MSFVNKKLNDIAHELASKIEGAKVNKEYFEIPFKHIILDNALNENFIEKVYTAFPSLDENCWEHTDNPGIEVKSRTTWKSEFDIPDKLSDAIRIFNSAPILKAMSEVLSIPKLLPDPYYSGGGLNVTRSGGLLDVHVDGNYHDASGLNRRVNILLYLNKGWKKKWGGQFGLYNEDGKELVKEVEPIFNRMVIFDTHDKSFHGLPRPITCPDNEMRRSILLYYYTVDQRPASQTVHTNPHSALWRSKGFTDKRGKIDRDFE